MEKAGLTGRVIVGGGDAPADGDSASAGGSAGAAEEPVANHGSIKFLTLEGADHFYNTLMHDHQKLLYTSMLDFLKNDCGPGGL